MEKILNYTQRFFLQVWATHFRIKTTLKTVKSLESNVLNCCLKITMADLRKIGVKMRE